LESVQLLREVESSKCEDIDRGRSKRQGQRSRHSYASNQRSLTLIFDKLTSPIFQAEAKAAADVKAAAKAEADAAAKVAAESKAAAKAMAATEAKAAAAAAAAIRKDNSNAADIFFFGFEGHNAVINGLYSPTQETGQDGRVLYRKSGECGEEALCIEHFDGRWRVKNQSHRGSVACFAHVEGCCALEGCRSRVWKVSDGVYFVDQPSVKMVTGEEAKSQASGRSVLAPEHTRASPSILSCV
jgi:hypothetical protein